MLALIDALAVPVRRVAVAPGPIVANETKVAHGATVHYSNTGETL